jgi:hypothetical protein
MDPAFTWMMAAAVLHFVEEFVYPGGFLRWMAIFFPRGGLTVADAVVINAAFFALVFSPLTGRAADTPILSLSVPSLLLANGALHLLGTFVTKRYSPGVVTAVLLYFPIATHALITLRTKWHLSNSTVVSGILLGIGWQLIPLARVAFRSALRLS